MHGVPEQQAGQFADLGAGAVHHAAGGRRQEGQWPRRDRQVGRRKRQLVVGSLGPIQTGLLPIAAGAGALRVGDGLVRAVPEVVDAQDHVIARQLAGELGGSQQVAVHRAAVHAARQRLARHRELGGSVGQVVVAGAGAGQLRAQAVAACIQPPAVEHVVLVRVRNRAVGEQAQADLVIEQRAGEAGRRDQVAVGDRQGTVHHRQRRRVHPVTAGAADDPVRFAPVAAEQGHFVVPAVGAGQGIQLHAVRARGAARREGGGCAVAHDAQSGRRHHIARQHAEQAGGRGRTLLAVDGRGVGDRVADLARPDRQCAGDRLRHVVGRVGASQRARHHDRVGAHRQARRQAAERAIGRDQRRRCTHLVARADREELRGQGVGIGHAVLRVIRHSPGVVRLQHDRQRARLDAQAGVAVAGGSEDVVARP